MIISKLCLLFLICKGVTSFVRLPCLTNDSKDFEDSQKALTNLESYLGTTIKTLENDVEKSIKIMKNHLAILKTNINQKVKTLNNDLQMLQDDFKKVSWQKHNGHCYHYGTKKIPWFAAEKRCREIGGYLVKVDTEAENNWISSHRRKSDGYWIGLTDLQEGKWRWSYDQSVAILKPWVSGYGNKGTSMNCVSYNGSDSRWFDYLCHYPYYFICESNFCST